MRIISGRLGGRNFASPNGHRTHPMSDKIRGALFNALGDIEGLTALDAFAGSGALSFEAVSRGATHAVAIDNDKQAVQTMLENVQTLQLEDEVKVIKAGAGSWLETSTADDFDIVLLDPPYDHVQPRLLERLAGRATVDGVIVMSLPPNTHVELNVAQFRLLQHKSYGDAELHFYRRMA